MKSLNHKGQALLETIFILPILIFIILFGFHIFKAIDDANIAQQAARKEILNHIDHRANGGILMREKRVVKKTSPSIQTSGLPILGSVSNPIDITLGICREVNCREEDIK